MSSWETINVTRDGAQATVSLARPDVRNAFDERLIDELTQAMTSLGQDSDIRVVVLTGEGRAFSAGVDLKALGARRLELWGKIRVEGRRDRVLRDDRHRLAGRRTAH